MTPSYQQLADEFTRAGRNAPSVEDLMTTIVGRLQEEMRYYDWVGFYMLQQNDGEDPVLLLGPYVGEVTEHTRIPLGEGICGAAASSGETVVVDDVQSDPRYLACFLDTRSEIVVPLFVNGKVAGELDIDSRSPAAFTPEDRELVEYCARVVGSYIERTA